MKGEPVSEHKFVKSTKANIMGVLYLDLETYPQVVGDVPIPETEDGYP